MSISCIHIKFENLSSSFTLNCFSGFVAHDKIESYIENREKFTKKGKGVDFHTAVAHMDEYISNKKVCSIILWVISSNKKTTLMIQTFSEISLSCFRKTER